MNKTYNKFILFISCLFLLLQTIAAIQKNAPIVGGEIAGTNRVPFLVQIYRNGSFTCGGTLISEKFVVSAAHCFHNWDKIYFIVAGGVTSIYNKYGVYSMVHKIHIPEEYNPCTNHMDVAVLELSAPLRGNFIRPINLCTRKVNPDDEMQIYGWGLDHEKGYVQDEHKTVTVSVIDPIICKAMYFNRELITSSMMCAFGRRLSPCNGDSGGPAIVNGELCGIVSFGEKCGQENVPSVYTDVIAAKKFIESTLLL